MIVLHENKQGVQIIREDYVKRSAVKVISNSRTLRIYRFNNIPFYEHPLLSWANLDCCNGWSFDKDYLLTAVQKGKKPVAEISDLVLPAISPGPDYEVWYNPEKRINGPYVWKNMIISKKGTLSDFFDLNEIVTAYERLGIKAEGLEKYFSSPLLPLFSKHTFWVNPGNRAELIIAGLGLGYPIESTASIIEESYR